MPIDKQTPVEENHTGQHPRTLPWSPLLALLIVVGIFFGSQYIGAIAVSIYPITQGWTEQMADEWLRSSAAIQFVYVFIVEALTLGLLYMFLRRRKRTFRDLGLIRFRLKDLGVALLAYPPYFLVNAAALIAASEVLKIDLEQRQQTGFEFAQSPTDLILTFVSLVILPPIVEEIVMRGFLFGSLRKAVPVIWAAIITSAFFAVAHLQFGSGAPLLWAAAIDTFVLSLVLCYLRVKTGSLWAGIILHMMKNGLAFVALFVLKQ